MKKSLLTFVAFAGISFAKAQNSFPGSGDAYINSSIPAGHGSSYNALWMPNASALMPENAPPFAGIMLTANVIRTSATNIWGFANSTLPAWKLYLGYGSNTDFFTIARSAPTNYSEQTLFKITNTGNVGIGTTDNSNWQLATSIYKLAVNGSAIATSMTVKASTSWPDYVFKPTYTLPSLTEVKTYIDQNHHLPEIPTEQQIEKDGLNLGEVNKLLVKKVKELTLYMIENDKEMKQQQAEISVLKQQVALLIKSSNKN